MSPYIGATGTSESPAQDQEIDALDALEEKWRTEPADLAGWSMRAFRTLNLARRWRSNAKEWERIARKGAH